MKKYLLILLLIIFSLPAFAEYKPIPAERSAEYKAEIEQVTNNKYLPFLASYIPNYYLYFLYLQVFFQNCLCQLLILSVVSQVMLDKTLTSDCV